MENNNLIVTTGNQNQNQNETNNLELKIVNEYTIKYYVCQHPINKQYAIISYNDITKEYENISYPNNSYSNLTYKKYF